VRAYVSPIYHFEFKAINSQLLVRLRTSYDLANKSLLKYQ